MKKRILSILTCLALCLSLLPTTASPALAATTSFYYKDLDGNAVKVESGESVTINTVSINDATWSGDSNSAPGAGTINTWHVLSESSSSQGNNRITVSGHVNLVLLDGNTLGGEGNMTGISVPSGASLTIWAGSTDNSIDGTGKIAWGENHDSTGNVRIGGAGEITINGGTIDVLSSSGAGISGSTVTINGGTVTAESNQNVGIGGDTIEINGGTVDIDGYGSYGVLGGYSSDVTINGGTVTASNVNGTAIYVGSSGSFTVTGGTVKISGYTSSSTYNGIDGAQDAVISITGGAVSVSSVRSTVDVNVTGGLYINSDSNKAENYAEPVVKLVGTSDATSDDSMTITLTQDMTIPSGATLTIQEGQKLVIESGVTLTNNGTIFLTNPSNDTISGGGTLTGSGNFQYSSTKLPQIDGWIYDGTDHKSDLEAKFKDLSTNSTPSFSGITASGVSWTSISGDVSVGFYRVLNSGEVQSNETSEVDDAPPNGYVARVTFGESATVDIPFIVTPFSVSPDMLTLSPAEADYSGAAQTPTISLQLDSQTYPKAESIKTAFTNQFTSEYGTRHIPVFYKDGTALEGTTVTDVGTYSVGVKVNESTNSTVNFDFSLVMNMSLPTYTIKALEEGETLAVEPYVIESGSNATGTKDETTGAVTYYYTSQAIGFDPTVKYGTTTLVKGTDYEMTIKNSAGDTVTAEQVIAKGTYTISVTTKGGNLPANKTAEVSFTVGEGVRLEYNNPYGYYYSLYVDGAYSNSAVYGKTVYIGKHSTYTKTNNTGDLSVQFYSYDPDNVSIGGSSSTSDYGPVVTTYFNNDGTLTDEGAKYFTACGEPISFTHPSSTGAATDMTPYTIQPEDVGRRLIGQISSSVQSGFIYTAVDYLNGNNDPASDDAVKKATGGDLTGDTIEVANNYADTYTFDLKTILPELAESLTYGTTTFTVSSHTLNNSYYTASENPTISSDGILSLPIQNVNNTTTGSIGAITVSVVTQTHDFTGKTATITVNAVNKTAVTATPALSKSELTVGEALNTITFTDASTATKAGDSSVTVAGVFSWDAPYTVFNGAGSHTAAWTFTPQNADTYLPASGTATITVKAATRTITVNGEDTSKGTVTLSASSATQGTQITVTITEGSEYKLEELLVATSSGDDVSTDASGSGDSVVYTFTMPDDNVTVTVTWAERMRVTTAALSTPAEGKLTMTVSPNDTSFLGANVKYYYRAASTQPTAIAEGSDFDIDAAGTNGWTLFTTAVSEITDIADGSYVEVVKAFTIGLGWTVQAYAVSAPTDDGYDAEVLVSVTAPDAITGIANGTALAYIELPATVTITTDKGTMEAGVVWNTTGVGYNPDTETEQTFTVPGTVTLPDGVTNTGNVSLTVSVSVTVAAKGAVTVTGISVKTQPASTTYTEGDALDLTGLVVTLTYSDSSTADVAFADFDAKGVTVHPVSGTLLSTNETTVTVHAGNYSANFAITVNASASKAPVSLTLTPSKTSLSGGGTVTLTVGGLPTGGSVTVTCDNTTYNPTGSGTTWSVTLPNSTATYVFTASFAGNDTHNSATATCTVNVTRYTSDGGYTPPSTTPSTPSTPSVVSVTVPISGDDNTIHVKASVSGDKATIDEVDLSKLDTVIGDDVNTGVVTIDFSGLKTSKPITTVEIPADVVKQIAQAVTDPTNDAESLEIVFSDGTSIEFDAEALGEKSAQADGLDVTISIKHAEDAKPTAAQEEVIGDRPAFDITVTSGGKPISDMGGKVTVHAPYELREGEDPRGIVVWYVDEQGNQESCETSYDSVKKRVNWKTDHLSLYVIGYDEALAKSCPKDETCPMYPYTDVDVNAWYHDAVHYCMENGLMGSTSITESLFAPDATASRAMIATILHRMEGTPQPTTTGTFTDVADGLWYTEAVEWAAENGIVLGYNGKFDPDDPITREQLAVMLWRYAGKPATTNTELNFTDADEVSDWAMEALIWAQENGIMQGYNNAVNPQGNATRSCVAQMFKNFLEIGVS